MLATPRCPGSCSLKFDYLQALHCAYTPRVAMHMHDFLPNQAHLMFAEEDARHTYCPEFQYSLHKLLSTQKLSCAGDIEPYAWYGKPSAW